MTNPARILLVEDSEADIGLVRLAFEENKLPCTLAVAHNGVEALDYLRTENATDPDLILLDLNMPQMDGKQFLAMLKESDKHREIPVLLLTSSRAPHDIQECYQLNANGYIVKPGGFAEFEKMTERVREVMKLPENRHS